jgi:hypothetical protein
MSLRCFDQLVLVIHRHFGKVGERALLLAELEITLMKETQSNYVITQPT